MIDMIVIYNIYIYIYMLHNIDNSRCIQKPRWNFEEFVALGWRSLFRPRDGKSVATEISADMVTRDLELNLYVDQ